MERTAILHMHPFSFCRSRRLHLNDISVAILFEVSWVGMSMLVSLHDERSADSRIAVDFK